MIDSTQRSTRTHLIPSTMRLTRLTLWLNALSCLVFGTMFVFATQIVSIYLGGLPALWLVIVGVGLLIHAAHLVLGSVRTPLRRIEVYYFIAGDILWFIGSLIVLTSTDLITTSHGRFATIVVALMVLAIGIAQWVTYSRGIRTTREGT